MEFDSTLLRARQPLTLTLSPTDGERGKVADALESNHRYG
jgi:hypothetical protein